MSLDVKKTYIDIRVHPIDHKTKFTIDKLETFFVIKTFTSCGIAHKAKQTAPT